MGISRTLIQTGKAAMRRLAVRETGASRSFSGPDSNVIHRLLFLKFTIKYF